MNGTDDAKDEAQTDPAPKRPSSPPPDQDLLTVFQDLGHDLADFLERKTGAPVHIQTVALPHAAAPSASATTAAKTLASLLTFSYTPQEIKEHLDQFVIGQDEAKKALAIAICDHYGHLKALQNDPSLAQEHYQKQNILLLGPSGVGKTYLVKTIAQLIGVPFVKADANSFTETGFVGANAEDLVRDLVQMAGGNQDLAQYGIIYLDEIDKLAGRADASEISHRGVQNALLKLLEETEIDLMAGHDMLGQLQGMMEFQKSGKIERKVINTKYILFIVSGAFEGLTDIIKRRCHLSTINLVSPDASVPAATTSPPPQTAAPSLLQKVVAQDLVKFGLSPEFVGRLPIRVSCNDLTTADYARILRHSRGSILHQYRTSFANYQIEIYFTSAAIDLMAAWAAEEKTGARALVTIGDRILREFKFILPSLPINYLVVTPQLMQQPELYLTFLQKNPRAFDRVNFQEIVGQQVAKFGRTHHRSLQLTPEAVAFLYHYRRTRPPLAILMPKMLAVWQEEHAAAASVAAQEPPAQISEAWLKDSWELWHGHSTGPTAATMASRPMPAPTLLS